jgi:enamine deaminase RidA (YjgF/YER057c/UK114 family)
MATTGIAVTARTRAAGGRVDVRQKDAIVATLLSEGDCVQVLKPPGWDDPRGYSYGVAATGVAVFTAMMGWNNGTFESDDFVEQTAQTLQNIVAVIAEAGGEPSDIVKMTWYVLDVETYRDSTNRLAPVYREIMGRHYPSFALVEVQALHLESALIQIDTIAMVPAG